MEFGVGFHPEYFSIKLNHGGNIVRDIIEYYVGGTVSYVDYCGNDQISRIELQSMSKEVGYVEEVALFYKVQSNGKWVFKKIESDGDVTTMVQSLRNGLVEVFITDSNLEGFTSVEYNANVDVEDGLLDIDITSWEWDCGSFSQDNYNYLDFTTHRPSSRPNPPSTIEPLSTNEPPPTTRRRNARRKPIHHDSDSESDPDVFIDSDYEFSEDDDALFDANVDKDIKWCGVRKDKPKFRKYRPVLGKAQPIIEENMIFKNRAQCVEAIRQHAIVNGKAITFEKNDTDRVRAHCLAPCPWNILASSITGDRKTLQHLKNDLRIPNESTFTIISDKQKGLMNAIKDLLPCVEHRHCVRHLHSNMKRAGSTGQAVKDRLWNLARAIYVGRFSKLMEEFKQEDGAAFKWLAKHKPQHWCRSHFSVAPKCDMLLNNLCESFNATILNARDKPILTMLKRIRIYMIRHVVKRRASVEKWHGIPCAHTLVVLSESKKKAEGLVHEYYQKQTYINTYKHVIYPMNGIDMWEKTNKPPIQPPHYTRKSGRPKKCRRREADEPLAQSDGTKKMKRYLSKLSCRRCRGKGHNVRTCPSGFTAPRSKEQQCSQPISQPMFTLPSQPSQPTPKAPCRRGGIATRGGAARRGGAPYISVL
ncbi:hypothetical protein RHSIM_Rhsim04G0159500 [Rhododendron simsii]|uniref:Transposase n=1 Tax=Rhododendron simsii TaxID=118357 RepID=A0A834H602_RHOSS|nr:hypothetical protein RHSIM_Rhsim04G0159500 [Rhododendron simsii]